MRVDERVAERRAAARRHRRHSRVERGLAVAAAGLDQAVRRAGKHRGKVVRNEPAERLDPGLDVRFRARVGGFAILQKRRHAPLRRLPLCHVGGRHGHRVGCHPIHAAGPVERDAHHRLRVVGVAERAMVENVGGRNDPERREVRHRDRRERVVGRVAGDRADPRVHRVVQVMLRVAAGDRILEGVAVHLPHRPQPVDVAVMQVEHRVERRDDRARHMRAGAEPGVQAVVKLVEGHGARARLDRVLERRVVSLSSADRIVRIDGSAAAPLRLRRRDAVHPEGRVERPAGEAGGPPGRRGREIDDAGARRLGREIALQHLVTRTRIAVGAEKVGDEDRADRVGPIPVGQRNAGDVALELLLEQVAGSSGARRRSRTRRHRRARS